jgi:hypothetical protein
VLSVSSVAKKTMNFLTYFRAFSYAMIAVAMLALVLAGGLSVALALVFLGVMIAGWLLENTKWRHGPRAPDRLPLSSETPASEERSRLGFSLPDLVL